MEEQKQAQRNPEKILLRAATERKHNVSRRTSQALRNLDIYNHRDRAAREKWKQGKRLTIGGQPVYAVSQESMNKAIDKFFENEGLVFDNDEDDDGVTGGGIIEIQCVPINKFHYYLSHSFFVFLCQKFTGFRCQNTLYRSCQRRYRSDTRPTRI